VGQSLGVELAAKDGVDGQCWSDYVLQYAVSYARMLEEAFREKYKRDRWGLGP
jgi:hypothetical protein